MSPRRVEAWLFGLWRARLFRWLQLQPFGARHDRAVRWPQRRALDGILQEHRETRTTPLGGNDNAGKLDCYPVVLLVISARYPRANEFGQHRAARDR
jgi:hypothetical protein